MNPVLSGEPLPGQKCRVCGSQLPESLRCGCGAAYGESHRCPHCQSVADTEEGGLLRQRCRVCGGPRVVVDDAKVVRSGREIKPLVVARKAQMRRAAWAVSAGVVSGFAVLSLLVTLLVLTVTSPGVIGTLAMFGALAVPFVVAAVAWMRSKQHEKELVTSIDQAWAFAAEDVLIEKGKDLTSLSLAKILRMEEAEAEQLLAQLSASDVVRSRVTETGNVTYAASPKVRVGTEADEVEEEQPMDEAQVRARARAEKEG